MQILAEATLNPLFLPSWVFGIIAVATFTILGFVTFSYRDVANRHANKAAKAPRDQH